MFMRQLLHVLAMDGIIQAVGTFNIGCCKCGHWLMFTCLLVLNIVASIS
jgi:hypothetical protein